MTQDQIKIFNVTNGIILTVISYVLYCILWFIIDDDIQFSEHIFSDILMDFLFCAVFSFISLALCHLIFKVLKFHTGFRWSLAYSCILFLLNNIIALIMSWVSGVAFEDLNNPLSQVQGIYTYAMLATLVSSTYIISAFMNNYNLAMEDKRKTEIMLMKEKEAALEAQLSALKMQINPHFLFNNFSTLTELIESEPETAGIFLSHLSKVYRHIVRNLNVNLIDVKDELKFIDSYVYLMKLRHGDGILIDIDEGLRFCNSKIPPVSLQLLVENAIKHNAFSTESPLTIQIIREDDRLIVRNLKQPLVSVSESTGVGLANILSRYSLLSKKEVEIDDTEHFYSVSLPLL